METLSFDVSGMTCGRCAGSVRNALSKIAGVGHIEVTFNPGIATLAADPSRVSAAEIETAITELGYAVTAHRVEYEAAPELE